MKIAAVLVRTENAANVGAAVRALANMGGDRLILIDPRCEINSRTRKMAAGAQEHVRNVVTYPDWDSFYAQEPDGLRLALTRRGGKQRKVLSLRESLTDFAGEHLYLIFGPEADGLAAEDLAFVHQACHLPVFGEFGSLNLAQAVLLGLFIAREHFPPGREVKQLKGECAEAAAPFYFPDDLIKRWLMAMGFQVEARKASAFLTLRRLFMQNRPTRHEIQVLESILQQNIRKLLGLATEKVEDVGDVTGQ